MRRTVRAALAIGILVFAWWAVSAVASHAAGAWMLVVVATLLLFTLAYALGRQRTS